MKADSVAKVLGTALLAVTIVALPMVGHAAGLRDMGMGGGTNTVTITAGQYRLTLVIGPLEQMYTQAEYKKKHPRTGEIMLSGTMAMGGMGMNMPNHHLELHVMDLHTMQAVSNAMVTITFQPKVGMGQMAIRPQNVPVAVMRGIGMGMSDVHYGNNVYMPAKHYNVWGHVNKVSYIYTNVLVK